MDRAAPDFASRHQRPAGAGDSAGGDGGQGCSRGNSRAGHAK
jgi:hypothetical protein